ncbi:hypothetical protein Poli38472_014134 [Pythium oligandrum]|uniref:DUSP domain-containing protein n=1 Tax=Pythium oligandrum TaxID=41045 RepID=A0A8K1CKP5_PYTOL|nr:hypothetical protein Poli38472_014134 [Pythium oligandrum]|eukprot:TMW64017.1 hypothetical protein Poli38472_014134 [Pythium oligandrum]
MLKLVSSWRSREEHEDEELTGLDLESGISGDALASPRSVGFGRPVAEERRRLEREMILRHDTRELKRGEAWFIIETSWLDAWMAYILSEDDPDCPVVKPGPLTNYTLFDPKEYCLKRDLVATKHYRGVNPMVYAMYAELYGTAGAKPIVRWTLDIYATPVMIDDVKEMLHGPELKARVEVSELNDMFDFEERPDRSQDETWLYRCCCRCEFLVPCLGRLLMGPTYAKEGEDKKKKKGKKRRKKRRSYDDDDEEDDSSSGEDESETRGLLG